MKKLKEGDPYRVALIQLISLINQEIPLPREDVVLTMMLLDTEEKVIEFNEWVKTKIVGQKMVSTPEEIMNVVSKIGKKNSQ